MAARIKKGDTVVVISGRDKGKQGTVLTVIVESDQVLVQGVNMVWKHQKPTQRQPEGKRFQKEAPLAACKVMPVDPQTGKGTRVKFEVKDGKKVRLAVKTGNALA
ncbi:MAG: 50S ribosomal protein L24 [Myxococcales bacterium]|nr:50S ribosomal protein L24 [Myxococcales bacterium]